MPTGLIALLPAFHREILFLMGDRGECPKEPLPHHPTGRKSRGMGRKKSRKWRPYEFTPFDLERDESLARLKVTFNWKSWNRIEGETVSASELTQEYLKTVLDYDLDTGFFKWKRAGFGVTVGKVAGRKDTKGHIQIRIDGGRYSAHRLAWFWVYG